MGSKFCSTVIEPVRRGGLNPTHLVIGERIRRSQAVGTLLPSGRLASLISGLLSRGSQVRICPGHMRQHAMRGNVLQTAGNSIARCRHRHASGCDEMHLERTSWSHPGRISPSVTGGSTIHYGSWGSSPELVLVARRRWRIRGHGVDKRAGPVASEDTCLGARHHHNHAHSQREHGEDLDEDFDQQEPALAQVHPPGSREDADAYLGDGARSSHRRSSSALT